MDLTIVVPVQDEAGNLTPLMDEIKAALDGVMAWEVVFVDDGSKDGSADEMARLAAENNNVRVVSHRKNCGKSRALISAIRVAAGPMIVTIDGDGQDNPAEIPLFWAKVTAGGQPNLNLVVSGWRKNRKDGTWRMLISRFANKLRSTLLGDSTPDSGCGFKMFPRDKFLELPRFDNMHRFLPALFKKCGCELTTQEINQRPRTRGKSKYGTFDRAWVGFWDLMGVMWLQRRTRYPEVVERGREES